MLEFVWNFKVGDNIIYNFKIFYFLYKKKEDSPDDEKYFLNKSLIVTSRPAAKYQKLIYWSYMNIISLKQRPKIFRCLFGLTPNEFDTLCSAVTPLWYTTEERYAVWFFRKRNAGGRQKRTLSLEETLAMLLLYYRAYVPHVVLGELFGTDDSLVCRYFIRFEPVVLSVFNLHKETIAITGEEVLTLCIDTTE